MAAVSRPPRLLTRPAFLPGAAKDHLELEDEDHVLEADPRGGESFSC